MIILPLLISCAQTLVADDPFQYESNTTEELQILYWGFKMDGHKSDALINEIKKRVASEDVNEIDRARLVKLLNDEELK